MAVKVDALKIFSLLSFAKINGSYLKTHTHASKPQIHYKIINEAENNDKCAPASLTKFYIANILNKIFTHTHMSIYVVIRSLAKQ